MQHATYTLAVGVAIKPGIGGYIQNLLSNETRLLTDVAISETGRPGMVLATRLLDYGNYVTTGGASIPVGMISCDEMEEWQRAITLGRDSSGFDPADLIVTCLKGDPWSCSNFAELNRYVKTNIRRLSQKTELSQRKSALARRVNRASLNHRCKCGSGKMAKNCCGMRQAS
ncbi:MAG: hypothetical protein KDA99_20150, partial [Planctomycetales bacterium]|nr:hypothetical protein [Planctomycetales bacterium]